MRQFIQTIIMLLVAIVLPLSFKPQLLLSWPVWILSFVGIFLNLNRPLERTKEKSNFQDRFSNNLLLLAILLCFMIPIVEYAYGEPTIIEFKQLTSLLGLVLILIGLIIRFLCFSFLGRFFVEGIQVQSNHKLIKIGPYKYLRHPSYLGAWIRLLGISIFMQSKWGVLWVCCVVFPIYSYRIFLEERVLTVAFPEEYYKYKKNTWKMFPFIF